MSATITIKQALLFAQRLEAVSDSARIDVEVLLAAVLQKDRTYCYTWPEKYLSIDEEKNFNRFIERRLNGEPIAYIIGRKDFWSLSLEVNNSTLIPRPDTELLVERVLSLYENDLPAMPRTVIDLGTGTGAIALAIASEKPHWHVLAVDYSQRACALAEKNKQANGLENVEVICSDWLHNIEPQLVDCIVSNPPYIDAADPHLEQGDVRFEPRSALVADKNGLADIEQLVQQAVDYLSVRGYLLIEHGYQQAGSVTAILEANGFEACITYDDLAGHPRVTVGQYVQGQKVHSQNIQSQNATGLKAE